jgi:hypothetical protein
MNDAAPPTYVARANVLEHEAIWRLSADALELQGGPTAGPEVVMRFPYPDIVGVRLSYAPSRVDSARYRCDLTILGFVALLIVYTRKNWPRRFAPDAIPKDVLP